MTAAILGRGKNSARVPCAPASVQPHSKVHGRQGLAFSKHSSTLAQLPKALPYLDLPPSLPANGSTSTTSLPASLLSSCPPLSSMTPVSAGFLCLSRVYHLLSPSQSMQGSFTYHFQHPPRVPHIPQLQTLLPPR